MGGMAAAGNGLGRERAREVAAAGRTAGRGSGEEVAAAGEKNRNQEEIKIEKGIFANMHSRKKVNYEVIYFNLPSS
jgi:succinate dehydrogenase/fumarate reductase flavoprotein subunit